MNSPLLSIIIPLYNAESSIGRTLVTILNQSYQKLEIIVINDCSTDRSLQIVKSFADPRIRLFHNEKNQGPFFSRNVGLMYSKGDFITNVDADDVLSPTRFESMLTYFDNHPKILYAETRYLRFYQDDHKIWFRNWTRGVGYPVFRRKVFEEIGYFLPLRAGGDSEYSLRAQARYGQNRTAVLDDFTYWAEQSPKNLTSSIPIKSESRIKLKEYVQKRFDQRSTLYVDFPFTRDIIDEFSDFDLFIPELSADLSGIQEINPEPQGNYEYREDLNLSIIHFNEQTVTEYYRRLQQAFENFRMIQKKLRLKKPKSNYDFADFDIYTADILAEIDKYKRQSFRGFLKNLKKLVGL